MMNDLAFERWLGRELADTDGPQAGWQGGVRFGIVQKQRGRELRALWVMCGFLGAFLLGFVAARLRAPARAPLPGAESPSAPPPALSAYVDEAIDRAEAER